jgi:peroxiredoxin
MLAPGDKAPDFELADLRGSSARLTELATAGPVLLAFFKVSCPVCQFTLPFLDRMATGLKVYGISQDNAGATQKFNREFEVTFPTLLDANGYPASNAFEITHVPSMFLVERDGTISWALDGFSRGELDALGKKFGVVPFHPGERVPDWKAG